MKKILFAIFISSICLGNLLTAEVVKIKSLDEMSLSSSALVLFDIDDTLIDSSTMLGSKAWRNYIREATKDDDSVNWHDLISLFIAQNHPYETVEPHADQKVAEFQNAGHIVCGFTSRERNRWYDMPYPNIDLLTWQQLNAVNIQFSHESLLNAFPQLADVPQYNRGSFFADIEPKGKFLHHMIKTTAVVPRMIVFVDDKLAQVESVEATLTEFGIDHVCYWYCAIEEKAKQFNPLIANIELYYLLLSQGNEYLSDSDAKTISQLHPEKDNNYYLEASKKLLTDLAKYQSDK